MSEGTKPQGAIHVTAIEFMQRENVSGSVYTPEKHKVRFDVFVSGRRAEIPITLNYGFYEESRVVPVARDALHRFAAALAAATEQWKLPDDQTAPDYPKGFWKLPGTDQ